MSWTGSERQRREQGGCRPPTTTALPSVPRYRIPAGTRAFLRLATETTWHGWTTRRECCFDRREWYEKGWYVFRTGGYLLRVHRSKVVHGEDGQPRAFPRPKKTRKPRRCRR